MKLKLLTLVLLIGMMACQGEKPQSETTTAAMSPAEYVTAIEDLGKKMYNSTTNRLDNKVAQEFIKTCEAFVKADPQNEAAAGYLLKSGETARTMKNFNKGLALYDRVIKEYPNDPKAPQALFLKGFTLDNDMNQQDQAKAIYESFLEKYPDDEFADDTKFLLENLGKTDDEIIKSFEKNKKK